MAEAYTCQRCGAAVGPEAAHGLCPPCLLEEGLRDSQAATLPSGAVANSGAELAELGRLFPQLDILELVGRGGMGVVYKGRQRGLDRLVALKVLPPEVDRDPGFRERFIREARALARLTHPNIVAVYDFGQVEGRYYFLMEFVDGANLRRMLQAGHLTPQQSMAIVPQLCDALQFAHEEGIVHRDIKPENILVDRKGRVKIADFGLAKLLGGSVQQDPYTLTSPQQVLGTPHYMAPEQFERPGTVDHRADIYSMGVVFYEMLTGELPLGRFPPPSRRVQVDVRLDEVVLRTLEKAPEQRYQRADEVKTELASLAVLPPDGGPPTWSARVGGPPHASNIASAGEPARISRLAIAGLLAALAFPIAIAVCGVAFVGNSRLPTDNDKLAIEEIAAMWGIFSAVVSCGFGLFAIRRIRRSGGRVYGLRLALTDALLYPLLAYDVMVVRVLIYLLEPRPAVADRIAVLLFLGTLAMDVFFARRIWRRISQPLPAPPFVARPGLPQLPSRSAQPPNQYALQPRRNLGCLSLTVVLAAVILLAFVSLLVPMVLSYRALNAALVPGQGSIRAEVYSDTAASAADAHTYRFEIHSPVDCKTTVWAEIWRDGKRVRPPGFDGTLWVIPPHGVPFDGLSTFTLKPNGDAKIKAGWQISGNAGSHSSEESINDPFAGTSLRDSTWGVWTGSWSISPGRPIQILVLRGGKHRLLGSASDEKLIGNSDAEIRLFARFDPLSGEEKQHEPSFGESALPPNRGPSPLEPAESPSSLSGSGVADPPAIRGTAADGIVR